MLIRFINDLYRICMIFSPAHMEPLLSTKDVMDAGNKCKHQHDLLVLMINVSHFIVHLRDRVASFFAINKDAARL